jgi:di/tricarboxylate transporter
VSAAAISVVALVLAIVISIVSRVNVGLVAIAFAWLIGTFVEGVGTGTVIDAFPGSLFLTLAGVTLLFAVAQQNGTLEHLAHRTVGLARGNARYLPLIFFAIAAFVSMIGPGAIASVALVVPLAMAIGERAKVPHFLTALMVANGANAGNLSPISAVGVIANTSMASAGLVGHEGKVWFANLVAHVVVAMVAYVFLGGWRLGSEGDPQPLIWDGGLQQFGRKEGPAQQVGESGIKLDGERLQQRIGRPALSAQERLTVVVIVAWIAGVLLFEMNLGLSAFAAAAALVAFRAVEDGPAIARMPWGPILMVSGVSLLVGVLEATGGMELFSALLARLATPQTVNGVIAFVTGAISLFSSTSGVVLPAFLPTSAELVERLGGGDPVGVALSINVGASLVDVSPLSTLGALCVAAVADIEAAARLFRQLLVWGLAMTVVGAFICQLFVGALARM